MTIPDNIKNKLLPYQIPHVNSLIYSLKTYDRALDASDTGTGKTHSAVVTAMSLGLKPLVICPKSVLGSWKSVLKNYDASYYGLSNYESIQNCKMFTAASKHDKVTCQWIKRIVVDNKKVKEDETAQEVKRGAKIEYTYVWNNIPKDIILIFDEAHRCKNSKTLNNILLLTAARATCKILLLSATVADKPENFALTGLVLGLYRNIRESKNWIENAGKGLDNVMQGVHKELVPEYMSRMRIKDLGDLFPENQILAECYDMDNREEIQEQYKLIEEEFERLKKKEESSGCALARILYARMKIEHLRVPTFIDMAKTYLDEGNAVVVFVNFTTSLKLIADELGTSCVIFGEQSLEEREKNIADFNKDKSQIIVVNIRSGGVGVSLHDLNGVYPRVSIISPSWSAQDIIQALGRIHRANGKTKVRQRIVYCKDTIEEDICGNMKDKIKNIAALNDGNTDSYKIEGLMDGEVLELDGEMSEFDIIFQRIRALNAKKERLKLDLEETEKELRISEETLNALVN